MNWKALWTRIRALCIWKLTSSEDGTGSILTSVTNEWTGTTYSGVRRWIILASYQRVRITSFLTGFYTTVNFWSLCGHNPPLLKYRLKFGQTVWRYVCQMFTDSLKALSQILLNQMIPLFFSGFSILISLLWRVFWQESHRPIALPDMQYVRKNYLPFDFPYWKKEQCKSIFGKLTVAKRGQPNGLVDQQKRSEPPTFTS